MSLNVLVVDDNEDTGFAVELLLSSHGFPVRRASDGPSALEEARRTPPGAVFLDIGLPGEMDGFELARQLRELLGPEIRLIALTGRSAPEDRQRGQEVGLSAFLVKPATLEEMLAELP